MASRQLVRDFFFSRQISFGHLQSRQVWNRRAETIFYVNIFFFRNLVSLWWHQGLEHANSHLGFRFFFSFLFWFRDDSRLRWSQRLARVLASTSLTILSFANIDKMRSARFRSWWLIYKIELFKAFSFECCLSNGVGQVREGFETGGMIHIYYGRMVWS